MNHYYIDQLSGIERQFADSLFETFKRIHIECLGGPSNKVV